MKVTKRVVEKLRGSIARDAKSAVAEWLEQGVPLNAELAFGPTRVPRTMLDYACERNAYKVASFLIKAGAALNKGRYSNPLITAILFDRRRMVALLLDTGANPNTTIPSLERKDSGFTPLMMAASLPKRPGMVDYLIKRGADPQRRTCKGNSALTYALQHRNRPVIRKLLKLGVRSSGAELRSALGDLELLRALIQAGADVNATTRGKFGFPNPALLEEAIQERDLSSAEIFSGNSREEINIRRRDTINNRRLLEIIKELIRAGADLNRITVDDSPLARCALLGDLEVAKLLLKAGADPKKAISQWPWTGKFHKTAVEVARDAGHHELAEFLIAAGVPCGNTAAR